MPTTRNINLSIRPEDILAQAYRSATGFKPSAASVLESQESESSETSSESHDSYADMPHVHFSREDDVTSSSSKGTSESSSKEEKNETPESVQDQVDFITIVEDPEADDEKIESAYITDKCLNDTLRFHNWFITLFTENWTPNFNDWSDVVFAVYTKEIAPTTGNVHYHCYLELKEKFSRKYVSERLSLPKCQISPRLGTQKQAIIYCTKQRTRYPDFTPVFFGRPKCPRYRSDLDWLVEAVTQGATVPEIIRMGGGNAMRYIGMIRSTQEALLGNNKNDVVALYRRQIASANKVPLNRVPAYRFEDIPTDLVQKLRNGIVTDEIEKEFGDMSDALRRSLLMLDPSSRKLQSDLDTKRATAKPTKKEKPIDIYKGLKVYKKFTPTNVSRVQKNISVSVIEYLKVNKDEILKNIEDEFGTVPGDLSLDQVYPVLSNPRLQKSIGQVVYESLEEYAADYAARSFPGLLDKDQGKSVVFHLLTDELIESVEKIIF